MTQTTHQGIHHAERLSGITDWMSRGNLPVLAVWAVAALILTALLFDRLADPPLWDAAWGTSAGAAELAQNGFDYRALLSAPPFDQGGPGTHASSLLTLLLGFFLVVFGSPGGLVAGHVLMLVIGGALVASTFALARRYLPVGVALAVAAAVTVFPLIVQQVADPYIELPLALFTVLTVLAFLDRRRFPAVLFAALAIWFKPTGLILLPLIAVMGDRDETRRWVKNGVAVLVALTPFTIELMSRSLATHAGAAPTASGTLILMEKAFWILGATTDVMVVLFLFIFAAVRRRQRQADLMTVAVLITLSFFALHVLTMALSQVVTILPRYYVAVLPLWLVAVAVDLVDSHSRYVAVAFLVVLMGFSAANWNGTLYPLADHGQAPMAERTPGGGQEYLRMEIEGTRALVDASDRVEVLIVGHAVQFRVLYPELGFVERTPDNIVLGLTHQSELPDSFAWLDEPHVTSSVVTPDETAAERGAIIERTRVWDGRWQSDLVLARSP